ncbi:MAG: SDR family oxidoreductase [Chloroflexota bacterium]
MTDHLQGKTALITGASSGLGADFARQLAERGCDLILTARRGDRLDALREEISKQHDVRIECLPMDLLEADAPQRLFGQLKEAGQTVDILINNAGLGVYGEFKDTPWQRLHQMLEVDVVALTHLTRLFVPDMVRRDSGYILLIGSTGSFQPTPTYAVYAAAKSYVLSFGEALHYELRKTNVKCTVLCPGVARTEFLAVANQKPTAYQRRTAMESAEVVRIGIKALLKGRSCVVAGNTNALFAWLTRLLPRQTLAAAANQFMH